MHMVCCLRGLCYFEGVRVLFCVCVVACASDASTFFCAHTCFCVRDWHYVCARVHVCDFPMLFQQVTVLCVLGVVAFCVVS